MSKPTSKIYEYTVTDVHGNYISLEKYRGKACVIVNISEKTDKAAKILKTIYLAFAPYVGKNVKLLLFPCFQFGITENVKDLIEFVNKTSPGVGDVFEPIDVNGGDTSDLYTFLKQQQPGKVGGLVEESFTIFITNRQGVPLVRLNPGADVDQLRESFDLCLRKYVPKWSELLLARPSETVK